MSNKTDFLVITPLEEEWTAIRRHFPEAKRLPPDESDVRVYFQATISVSHSDDTKGVYRITFASPLGMGLLEAATVASDAIRKWQPRYVALCGIAGGVAGRAALGDVLIADQFVNYELQKLRPGAQETRYSLHRADPRLLDAVRYVEAWEGRTRVARPIAGTPRRHIGPVITGDKVLADGKLIERYVQDWPKLVGVEMEAGGVAAAAFQAPSKPGVIMVRGVSDLANPDKDSPAVASMREYACDVAAAFLRAFLESGPVPFAAPSPVEPKPAVDSSKPTESASGPSRRQVSALLYDVLRGASTFDAFCLDCFTDVFRRFGNGMDREARHTMLLSEHDPQEVVDALRRYDREKFERYEKKHLTPSAPVEVPAPRAPAVSTPPPSTSGPGVRVACFFAQADGELAAELRMHLGPLVRSNKINYWSVGDDILPGGTRQEQIHQQIDTAQVLLFLTSASLFADPEAHQWVERALARRQENGAWVIPIMAQPVLLSETALGELMPLPGDGRPVSQWRSRAEAWVAVVEGIRKLLPAPPR